MITEQLTKTDNPVGLTGMDFMEYSGQDAARLQKLFKQFGFEKTAHHKTQNIELYQQGQVSFVLNLEPGSFAEEFRKSHGPSACSTGFRVKNGKMAFQKALERGAKPYTGTAKAFNYPAIYGIGDSLVYFLDQEAQRNFYEVDFGITSTAPKVTGFGALVIDHMTNNVPSGEMQKWCQFYEQVFNFSEKRFFDIKGSKTGLISKVMRSPCGGITIPINEPTDGKSQIQEYLDEYKGSGIQHIALLSNNIVETVTHLRAQGVEFLDAPDTYFDMIPNRVPNVTEDIEVLKKLRILVDGDQHGYLLQIFTQNQIGPIFFEIIQRKGHDGFGDGNFQALFEAIERDQMRRGVL